MLKILVGNVNDTEEEDWCFDKEGMMPRDQVARFCAVYSAGENITIRVFSDTIINYVGHAISVGLIKYDKVLVITNFGEHHYTQEGVMDNTWHYGIFCY